MKALTEHSITFLLWVVSFFAPTYEFLLAIGFMVACDTVLGILAAKKNKEAIVSRRLYRTAAKFATYGVGILAAHVLCTLLLEGFPGVKIVGAFFILVEFKSIDEKIFKLTGVSIIDAIINKVSQIIGDVSRQLTHCDGAVTRRQDTGDNFSQGGFARAVPAGDKKCLTAGNGNRDILKYNAAVENHPEILRCNLNSHFYFLIRANLPLSVSPSSNSRT